MNDKSEVTDLSYNAKMTFDRDFVLPFLLKDQAANGKIVGLSESVSSQE